MSWSNQGGGPRGGQRPGGGGGGPVPPNLEEMLRRGQNRIGRVLSGGFGGGRGILLVGLALVVLWLLTGLYRVQPDEQGVELLFGKWTGATTEPGLHYWFPTPIGDCPRPGFGPGSRLGETGDPALY